MSRVRFRECMRVAIEGPAGMPDGGTGAGFGAGLLFGLWWWVRGVPEDWLDPDDPSRLRF